MVEVPLFPTIYSPVLTLPTLLRIPVVWGGEHHSHNFPSRNPDSRSHKRASTPAYYNNRLSGFWIGWQGSRIEICLRVAPSCGLLLGVSGSAQTVGFPIQYSFQIRVPSTLLQCIHPDLPIGVSKCPTRLSLYPPTFFSPLRT